MNYKYTLYDFFDQSLTNPIKWISETPLKAGSEFCHDDVSYRVTKVRGEAVIVRMAKYKIPDSATQFVHKCPAKRSAMQLLERKDIVDLDKSKKRNLETYDRMKMLGHMQQQCPHCKTVFWKSSMNIPDSVEVPKVYRRSSR